MNYIKNCKKLLAATVMLTIGTCGNQVSAQTHTANDRNGVPGLKVTLNESRIRHSGNEIVFYPIFQKTGNKNIGQLCIDNNRYAWIDGEEPLITYMPSTLFEVPADGEPVLRYVEIKDVPITATTFTKLKIVGRAPESAKSTSGNYYGDFDYTFRNVPIPQFHHVPANKASGIPGGMFTDNEIKLAITGAEMSGADLFVTFTLTNIGKTTKNIEARDGYATTENGDRLQTSVRIPKLLEADDMVKGVMTIKNGAEEVILSAKHNFCITEKSCYWYPQLILNGKK